MKPLRSLLGYALRHKKITGNPFDLLTEDDRADDDGERFVGEWSDQEIERVIAKADELGRRPEAKQEYAPFVLAAIETGERLGELLGSDWGDLDLDAGTGTSQSSGRSTANSQRQRRRTASVASR